MKYTVHALDVWGSSLEGWEIASVYAEQTVITLSVTCQSIILKTLISANVLGKDAKLENYNISGLTVENKGDIVITDTNNKPLLVLREQMLLEELSELDKEFEEFVTRREAA